MHSFEFKVVMNSPLETVFAVYVDTERWTNRNQLGDIRWVQGEPWAKGSRLRVEALVPISISVDQVVRHFDPPRSVIYASEMLGVTCETCVTFTPVSKTQTAINIDIELQGMVSRSLFFALEPAISKATKGFFEELRRDCEWATHEAASRGAAHSLKTTLR
jgi:hypothetical protein